ncbi:MAG: hypothetical protein QOI01_329 [Mycobacterium sp.]|jgi:hypothetical protein|nr:hypothetical protein [Mycobacterium sp.]
MDLLAGPLYWRLAVMQAEVSTEYCDRLATAVVTVVAMPSGYRSVVPK